MQYNVRVDIDMVKKINNNKIKIFFFKRSKININKPIKITVEISEEPPFSIC